jgi:hypothetical protein
MNNPITKDEIIAALKGAMKYQHPKDDSEEARTVVHEDAIKYMKLIDDKMRDATRGNSGLDMARFWFAAGLFTADARHGSQGDNLVIIPKL